ncbi:YqhR family membrane protein [Paenibacillus sp. N1-5-1-14]|uniref:YqhR family membrane protein n=1 Tax=Paenibacillus radicibacter TaxID=2972488 RepID=UPI00215927D2|nr:YqhR family membrane protein [Paenibacillus radicibacter]MCR8642433.1 YqhR family membrane protein [Paenibacillus radicibacter]
MQQNLNHNSKANKTKQSDKHTNTNRWLYALYIGFFAGLIWGLVKIVEYYFKFTDIVPGYMVDPFLPHKFLMQWKGFLVGLGSFIIFSIIASFVYMLIASKLIGPWPGLVFGALVWCLVYLMIAPMSKMIEHSIWKYGLTTIITEICLFLLWGLFIGYSISFEYNNESEREPKKGTPAQDSANKKDVVHK